MVTEVKHNSADLLLAGFQPWRFCQAQTQQQHLQHLIRTRPRVLGPRHKKSSGTFFFRTKQISKLYQDISVFGTFFCHIWVVIFRTEKTLVEFIQRFLIYYTLTKWLENKKNISRYCFDLETTRLVKTLGFQFTGPALPLGILRLWRFIPRLLQACGSFPSSLTEVWSEAWGATFVPHMRLDAKVQYKWTQKWNISFKNNYWKKVQWFANVKRLTSLVGTQLKCAFS